MKNWVWPNMTVALPTPALEAWRYSHLARAVALVQPREACLAPTLDRETLQRLEAALPVVAGPHLVLWRGQVVQALSPLDSLPAGVRVVSSPALPVAEPLDGLDALTTAGAVQVAIEGEVGVPLHLIHIGGGHDVATHVDITLAPRAAATVVEHHVALADWAGFNHVQVTLQLGEQARLTHAVWAEAGAGCVLTRRQRATLADRACYNGQAAQFGAGDGAWVRAEVHARLGTATEYGYTGLAAPRAGQHFDTTMTTHHVGEGNAVTVRQRNVIDGDGTHGGHAVFQGKFYVAPDAQKTNAYMHCHNLLLHDGAKASHKPELEIYADDVKCSHGAATGGLNPMQLFYLQARGFTPQAARALLVGGFMQEFVDAFPPALRPSLTNRVRRWLAGDALPAQDTPPDDMALLLGAWLQDAPHERM